MSMRPIELRDEIAHVSKPLREYIEQLEASIHDGPWVALNPAVSAAPGGQIAVTPFLILLNQRTGALEIKAMPDLPRKMVMPANGPLKEVPTRGYTPATGRWEDSVNQDTFISRITEAFVTGKGPVCEDQEVLAMLKPHDTDPSWMKDARAEAVLFIASNLNNDVTKVAEWTGLPNREVNRILSGRSRRLASAPGAAVQRIVQEQELEEVRWLGRKDMIRRLNEGAMQAIEHAISGIGELKANQAATVAGIFVDKALLLSGQATSRIARTDERHASDEVLRAKAAEMKEQTERLGKLKVVSGTK